MPTIPLAAALVAACAMALAATAAAQAPPLLTDILSADGDLQGEARVFHNYIEIADAGGNPRGAVGVVQVEGRLRLFLIKADQQRTLIGWAERHKLYDDQGELVGYYFWTPTFSYVYDPEMNKVGEARCLAYQGVCAAAVAGYLLGLL